MTLMLLALSACAGGKSAKPTATTSPAMAEPTATTSPQTSATADPTPCRSSRLAVSDYRGSGAGGHEAVVVIFTNTGSVTCTMSGYPSAWFVDAAGARIGPTSIHESVAPP